LLSLCPDPHVSYSITLMTSLDQPNGMVVSEPRQQSNHRWDFFGTMMDMIVGGFLQSGDIVVSPACGPAQLCCCADCSCRVRCAGDGQRADSRRG
jgi:hypothetical protein